MTRKLVWHLVFVFLAVGTGIYLSLKPWQVYHEQRKLADQARAEMQQADRARANLVRKKSRTESSVGHEELIRDAGYHKKNEIPASQD